MRSDSRFRVLLGAAVLAAGLSASGCGYLKDRRDDFCEIWRGDAGVGFGILASAQAGDLAHAGIGLGFSRRHGWRGEKGTPSSWQESEAHIPLSIASLAGEPPGPAAHLVEIREDAAEGAPEAIPFAERCFLILPIVTREFIGADPGTPWLHALDVSVNAQLIVPAFRIGFSPGETIDFLLGFSTLDLDGSAGRRRDQRILCQVEPPPPVKPGKPGEWEGEKEKKKDGEDWRSKKKGATFPR
ncbi:MAG: hypothetical protein AAB215_07590 [Planctomycetota bacterium]